MAAAVQVQLLGRFCVRLGDEVARFSTRKAESMFAYLLLSRDKPVLRETLAAMFWPDTLDTLARKNLNTTLWRIRKALGGDSSGLRIEVNDRYLALRNDQVVVEVDLFKFRSLLESSRKLPGQLRVDRLKEAEGTYGGVLMEGCSDEWCEEERRCVRGQYIGLLKDLAHAAQDARDYEAGADYAQRVIAQDPLDEDAHRELMLLRYLSGNRAAALGQYEFLRKSLREELGVEPTQATMALWEYIRADVSASSAAIAACLRKPAKEAFDGFVAIPMVGRDAHLRFLLRLLDSARTGVGAAVALCGEAGVGKTKLVEALAVGAALHGFEVLSGSSPDLKDPAPYHPFIQALWPRLATFEQLGKSTSSPLASLMDALAPDTVPATQDQGRGKGRLLNNAIVTEALLGLLLRTCGSRPTLLVLEDMHRIDRASADLLITLLGRIGKSNIIVVTTARVGECVAGDELLSRLESEGATSLTIERLTEEDTKKLIRAGLRSKNVAAPVVQYLWHQTAGNPLFILEFLKLLCAEGTLTKDALGHWHFKEEVSWAKTPKLPLRIQGVVRRRIDMLDSSARKILILAATLGIDVELGLLRQLGDFSDEALIEGTESLVREHLLEETASGFRFSHECIRAVALATPSKARKRLLHLRAAKLMEQARPGRTEDLAWHFEQAGDFEKALDYAEESGDKARLVHANDDAVRWYTHALGMQERLPVKGQSELLMRRCGLLTKRQDVLDILGDRTKQIQDIDSIYHIGSKLGDRGVQAQALSLRATLFVRLNVTEKAIKAATRARDLFSSLRDASGEARSYLTTGLALLNLRRYKQSYESIRRAFNLFHRAGNVTEGASALVYQAIVLTCLSNYAKALEYLNRAEHVLCGSEDLRTIAYSKMQEGVILRLFGKAESSRSLMISGMKMLRQVGDRVGEARALIQLALTEASLGRFRESVCIARRALRLARQTRDIRAQINILTCLGAEVYRCVGDFSRAKKCINESMKLIMQSSDHENLAMYQDSMAAVLLDEGNVKDALHWSKSSLALYESGEMGISQMAEIQYRLGCAYLELGDWCGAIGFLRTALVRHKRYGEVPFQIRTMVALSRAYSLGNDGKAALKCSRGALRLLRAVESVDQTQNVFWRHYQALSAVGAQIQAVKYLQRAHASVTHQASTLKGRMRTRFLTSIRDNREILEAMREVKRLDFPLTPCGEGVAEQAEAAAPNGPRLESDLFLAGKRGGLERPKQGSVKGGQVLLSVIFKRLPEASSEARAPSTMLGRCQG